MWKSQVVIEWFQLIHTVIEKKQETKGITLNYFFLGPFTVHSMIYMAGDSGQKTYFKQTSLLSYENLAAFSQILRA